MENLTIKEYIDYIKANWENPDVYPDIDTYLMNKKPLELMEFALKMYIAKTLEQSFPNFITYLTENKIT